MLPLPTPPPFIKGDGGIFNAPPLLETKDPLGDAFSEVILNLLLFWLTNGQLVHYTYHSHFSILKIEYNCEAKHFNDFAFQLHYQSSF